LFLDQSSQWILLVIIGLVGLGNCQVVKTRTGSIFFHPDNIYDRKDIASQRQVLEAVLPGAEDFALDFFSVVSRSPDENYMVSPFSLWSLLVLLSEGASGNTFDEIQRTLNLPDKRTLRSAYKVIDGILSKNTEDIKLSTFQALVTDRNRPANPSYSDTIEGTYKADLLSVDFSQPKNAYDTINDYAYTKTNGELTKIITPADVLKAQMILLSGIYFQGQWSSPFNESDTTTEDFYNEKDQKIGRVPMMHQSGPFLYAPVSNLDAHLLELPYGSSGQLSMVVILPRKGFAVKAVIEKLKNYKLSRLFQLLTEFRDSNEQDEVIVALPRFSTATHFNLVEALKIMGIRDMFDSANANLEKIVANKSLYVSSFIQKTKIQVDEKGTIASAVTVADLENKFGSHEFIANRPFAYLIIDRSTNMLLFCGQYGKPN
jgi:serine protease inhibitor